MAQLDKNVIAKLTKLCRIDCTEEEKEALCESLEKILDYMELLKEVDTEQVPPCNHVLSDIVNVMREDKVGQTLSRDKFLSNVPSQIGGLVRVPPILKNS